MNLKKHPYFLLLMPLFFCLHGGEQNFGFIELQEVVEIFVVLAGGILIVFFIFYFFSKNGSLSALVTMFISVWYLFFGVIKDLFSRWQLAVSYKFILPSLAISTVVVFLLLRKNKAIHQKLYLYLNVLLFLYCFIDIGFIAAKYFSGNLKPEKYAVDISSHKVVNKPNVYLLLFDEYPGEKSLLSDFSFSNDSLISALATKGFQGWPSKASYNSTAFSMSAILNMQPVAGVDFGKNVSEPELKKAYLQLRRPEVLSAFEKMGYRVKNFSLFDIMGQRATGNTSYILTHKRLLTTKLFHNTLFNDLGWHFVTGKYPVKFMQDLYLKPKLEYNQLVEKGLLSSIASNSNTPTFVYAHFLMPHPSYLFDSIGNMVPLQKMANIEDKSLFVSYLKYTNSRISFLTDKIIAMDPQSICIVLSDHGFRFASGKKSESMQFDNICFVRSQNVVYGVPSTVITGANLFRYILNTQFGQSLSYVQDSSVFVVEKSMF